MNKQNLAHGLYSRLIPGTLTEDVRGQFVTGRYEPVFTNHEAMAPPVNQIKS